MAETIRDVVIKVKLEKGNSKLDFSELSPVSKQLKNIETNAGRMGRQFESVAKQITDSQSKVKQVLLESATVAKKNTAELTDLRLKAADGFASAAEGAMTFARGLVFLGVSSEDNLKKVVVNLARVQAGLDLVKGTKDFGKGVIEGTRALSAAMTGARASSAGMTLALGPVGLALAAVSVAVAVGIRLWKDHEDAERKATEATKKAAEDRKKAREEEVKHMEEVAKRGDSVRSLLGENTQARTSRLDLLKSQGAGPQDLLKELETVKKLQGDRLFDLIGSRWVTTSGPSTICGVCWATSPKSNREPSP